MADFTVTVSNSVNCFGVEPPNLWNSINWGDNWGYGNNPTIKAVEKLISDDVTPTTVVARESELIISNSLSVSSETESEELSDGSGYNYVFAGPTTEAEDRMMPNWTDDSEPSSGFASAAVVTTTWGES